MQLAHLRHLLYTGSTPQPARQISGPARGVSARARARPQPPSHTMPESSLRSFRANVIPHSGSTQAPSCSRTALVGARPGTDCTGPDSAFSHDAGCQRPGVRPRHSRRHAPHHPVGAFALTGTASEGLRIACSDMAPMRLNHGPTARFSDLTFVNFRPQTLNHPLPRSARNHGCAPPHSLLFQVGTRPPIDIRQPTQIPVHGYVTTSDLRCGSGRPQTGTRRPRKTARCNVAASARATTPPGSFGSKSVEPALTRSHLLVPDVPAPNCLLRCIRLPGPPGNSDAHDQDAACSPAPSSVHGHDTANAPALPMPPMEDIHDRHTACQPSPRSRRRRVPTQPPARCRVPALWVSHPHSL